MRARAFSSGGPLLLAAVTVVAVGATAAAAPGGTSTAAGDAARGRVTYFSRACASDNAPNRAPVSTGELVLRRGGARQVVELGSGGVFSVNLPGSGDVKAELVLDNQRVRVVGASPTTSPGEVAGATAMVVPLVPAFNPAEGPIVLSPGRHADGSNGGVNILEVLDRGAQVANKARGAKLPKVTAQWFSDKVLAGRPGTAYADNVIVVGSAAGGPGSGPVPAEWEPVPLLHEYGHHLLRNTADPEQPHVTHLLTDVFPKQPSVAWGEGFASAFAAIVLKSGNLTVDCGKQYQNLATTPARPKLLGSDQRFAQYNETRTAAIAWRVMTKLGPADPAAGLAQLLTVLKTYRRDGKPLRSTRDLRDAIAMSFEKTKADHVAYDQIFQRQGVSWWRQLEARLPAAILVPPLPPGVPAGPIVGLGLSQAVVELQLRVQGPGGFDCRLKTDTGIADSQGKLDNGSTIPLLRNAASGGLAFSNNDDCWLGGGDGTPGTTLPGGVTPPGGFLLQGPIGGTALLPFPYLPNLAHWGGSYRVIARYSCAIQPQILPAPVAPPNCPASVPVTVNEEAQVDDPSASLTATVTLPLGQDVTLLTFEAQGGNCSLTNNSGPIDCSI